MAAKRRRYEREEEPEPFIADVFDDLKVEISISTAQRAIQAAGYLMYGNETRQFAKLWSYAKEIIDIMHGSTVIIKQAEQKFQRIYVCPSPLKKGFLAGCRRFLCLDGCFLKGGFKGQILAAVGLDVDNGIYPVAWAVVEVENTDSWTWFVRLLKEDLLMDSDPESWILMTDQQKMQIKSGRYHTLLINNSTVYSCGSCICGVLGHGPEVTQCVAFTRMSFPLPAQVVHVSASHNHAAFVTQSGEVFTCGDNSSLCCGHVDTNRAIFRPRCVEALNGVPCKQVAAGLSFTVFLSREGHVYSCGSNVHGQLGHGDNVDRATPKIIEQLACFGFIVQISAGPSYVLAVSNDGTLYSFGYGANFCLGHGEQHDAQQPLAVQSFRRRGIHVARVCAGDEHAIALDSSGNVYTWGKGYGGALGHGDETDKTTPAILSNLKSYLAVQVCASKRKTFVLTDGGSVFGFGWMAFGSLGFPNRGPLDKVVSPEVLESLRPHHISQVSTGLYHSVVVTNQGKIFGFGDNERAQLGHDTLRGCLKPTEIFVPDIIHESENLYQ